MAKTIITIGRQFGSNGRNIGRKLAEKISANFYDKELINETAKESGLSEEFLKCLLVQICLIACTCKSIAIWI